MVIGGLFCFVVVLGMLHAQNTPVEPVNWRQLTPLLVDFDGWKADDKPEGQTVSTGQFKITTVSRNYTAGDKEMEVQIVDGGYVQMAYMAFKTMMNFEVDSSEQLVRKITIDGHPGVEQIEYDDNEAKVMLLVGDRFLVTIEIENVKDSKDAKKIAEAIDLKKLAALK